MPSKISALGSMKKPTRPGDTCDTRPAATPNIPGTSDIPDDALPDINTLSLLAAQPRFFNRGNDTDALRAALALWREAKRLLDREQQLAIARNRRDFAIRQIKLPKKFPASFADFLRLVVGGKDEGEQLNRFRRFWLSLNREEKAFRAGQTVLNEGPPSEQEASEIGKVISDLRDAPLPQFVWVDYAFRFDRWWAVEKLEAKRRGGNARVAKARENKKSAKAA